MKQIAYMPEVRPKANSRKALRSFSAYWAIALVTLFASCEAKATETAVSQPDIPPTQGYVDLTGAAEKAVNSVVYVKVTQNSRVQTITYSSPFDDFFSEFFGGRGGSSNRERQVETPRRSGAGSGVILSTDGYIVTNNHVVAGADEIEVKLNDNNTYPARIIGTDESTDLALIKIEATELDAITMGNSDDLHLGEWVLAIGNPFSLTSTVTAGIVSAKARHLGTGASSIESFIQTDAAINAGNSGGALVNARGELVGINAMLYSQTGSFTGYGFAIPTTIVKKVVDDLKEYGTVQRAVLGVLGSDVSVYLDSEKEKGNNIDLGTHMGVYVSEVTAGGGAEAAGIESNDVITAIDGKAISKFGELQEALSTHRPGDKVVLTYLRDKKERKATVTLRNIQGTTAEVKNVDSDTMGAALRPLTTQEKQQFHVAHGLMVSAVTSGKMKEAGATKGIILTRAGDRDLDTLDDFDQALREANMSAERVLWIRARTQSGRNLSFVIELSDESDKR